MADGYQKNRKLLINNTWYIHFFMIMLEQMDTLIYMFVLKAQKSNQYLNVENFDILDSYLKNKNKNLWFQSV